MRRLIMSIAVALCRVSDPTARSYINQVALLGIADLTKGDPGNSADTITLAESHRWLKSIGNEI